MSLFENIDCIEGMKRFPDNHFDLAIVDPPYGIGDFLPSSQISNGKRKKRTAPAINWNNKIPKDEYFKELERVSKRQIIFGANYYNCFLKGGALIWYKGKTQNFFSQCEIASLSFQQKIDYVHINWQNGFSRKNYEKNYLQIHPCQKPIALYRWLLQNYAKEGDLILDTHVGSASSLIACEVEGFDYVGFELDKDYYEAAQKRMKDHRAQLRMAM